MSAVTKTWDPYKISVKPCLGSPAENRRYCGAEDYTNHDGTKSKSKNELFEEFGDFPQQGKRRDLDELKNSIINGEKQLMILLWKPHFCSINMDVL